jgi:hypothetical protein
MVTSEPEKVGKKKRMQALTFFFPTPGQISLKKNTGKKGSTGTATEPKVTASTKGYWNTPVAKKDDGPTALAPRNHESQGDPRGRKQREKLTGKERGLLGKTAW